ncbi:hypothetical protein GMB86_00990 [Terrilactibacillus sp. BCM23-1]|uniref:Uncharacterized protein n=1 Tax=Terrilactibacillus tamarindi TaxID=2599694 RepID=A0A6N8CMA5_9BACI|nr:hypothetical protein [Terrilactibacillus tamarindi]MTT30590.1 hypothetical protein [Terrilactibacillus tamarindi]
MPTIYIHDQPFVLHRTAFDQLVKLLPYWGLQLTDDNKIIGALKGKRLFIKTHHQELISQANHLLKHTSIGLYPANDDQMDLIASYVNDSSEPFMTIKDTDRKYCLIPSYHLNVNQSRFIYKGIWIPKQNKKYHITFHCPSVYLASEWLSYLILLHQSKHLPFLPPFKQDSYNYLVDHVLNKVNPSFAAYQKPTKTQPEFLWPVLPPQQTLKSKKKRINKLKHDTIQAFKNEPMTTTTFNPFKKERSTSTKMNPFTKKKHDY